MVEYANRWQERGLNIEIKNKRKYYVRNKNILPHPPLHQPCRHFEGHLHNEEELLYNTIRHE